MISHSVVGKKVWIIHAKGREGVDFDGCHKDSDDFTRGENMTPMIFLSWKAAYMWCKIKL